MSRNSVEMGWGAAPIKQQHPVLPNEIAEQFDKDNEAITRLHLRGLITASAAESARRKYASKVAAAITRALAATKQ